MKNRSFRIGTFTILAFCAVIPGIAWNSGVQPLQANEAKALSGGLVSSWCINTNTDCTDQNYSSNCTLMAGACWQCAMNVPNWLNCKKTDAGYECSQTSGPGSPWCGTVMTGVAVMGECPNCNTKSMTPTNCGSQIPTVTGVPCPPNM